MDYYYVLIWISNLFEREREREIFKNRLIGDIYTLQPQTVLRSKNNLLCPERERERSEDVKTLKSTKRDFQREREMGNATSSKERDDHKGVDGVNIDGDFKKTNDWKSLKEMKAFLKSEYMKKFQYDRGEIYFHYAASMGHVEATKVLLEKGADVNAACFDFKFTPLQRAAQNGHVDVVKMLIQNDADVNAVNEFNTTALQWAAHEGHVDVVKVLLRNGAFENADRHNKRAALQFACGFNAALKGHIACTLELLCFGAEIDEASIKGDKTKLLQPIESRLKLLRDGNRITLGTSLMSEEERRFMWNFACVLAIKHPAIAFVAYKRIRTLVTFHGIFMAPGYRLDE